MAAQYLNISRDEMDQFLTNQGFKLIQLRDGTVELVYSKRVQQDDLQLSLRVYTGILPSGNSRDVGLDAIRINLFLRTSEGKVVKLGGSKRVHRVLGWKKNLQARLDGWLDEFPKSKCADCGNPMIVREGKFGKFYSCVSCKKTASLSKG